MNFTAFAPPNLILSSTEQHNLDFTRAPPTMSNAQTQPTPLAQVTIPPPAPMQSLIFSGQQPIFNASGPAVSLNPMMNVAGPSSAVKEIGFDTHSKDPVMVRSRVFIGRLTNVPVTRDDLITLFSSYGTILGLNFFKQGYAFVQFSMASEADAAVAALDGKKWMGVVIDVHLVEAYTAKKRVDQQESTSRKRTGEDDDSRTLKLLRQDSATAEDIREVNCRNRVVALSDPTTNDDLTSSEIADTMICGNCRYITADYEAFKDHRIAGCNRSKDPDEPKYLKCASCDNRFKSSWALLCHLTEFHRMMLYKAEDLESLVGKETTSKSESELRSVSPETPPKEPTEKSREVPLAPTLQQPRTPAQNDAVHSPAYGPVFPNMYPRSSESWRQPTKGSSNGGSPVRYRSGSGKGS